MVAVCMAAGAALPAHAEQIVTQPIRTFGLGTLYAAAYSPDGKYIATCGGGGAFLWDVQIGSCIRTFTGHTGFCPFRCLLARRHQGAHGKL